MKGEQMMTTHNRQHAMFFWFCRPCGSVDSQDEPRHIWIDNLDITIPPTLSLTIRNTSAFPILSSCVH